MPIGGKYATAYFVGKLKNGKKHNTHKFIVTKHTSAVPDSYKTRRVNKPTHKWYTVATYLNHLIDSRNKIQKNAINTQTRKQINSNRNNINAEKSYKKTINEYYSQNTSASESVKRGLKKKYDKTLTKMINESYNNADIYDHTQNMEKLKTTLKPYDKAKIEARISNRYLQLNVKIGYVSGIVRPYFIDLMKSITETLNVFKDSKMNTTDTYRTLKYISEQILEINNKFNPPIVKLNSPKDKIINALDTLVFALSTYYSIHTHGAQFIDKMNEYEKRASKTVFNTRLSSIVAFITLFKKMPSIVQYIYVLLKYNRFSIYTLTSFNTTPHTNLYESVKHRYNPNDNTDDNTDDNISKIINEYEYNTRQTPIK